MDMVYIHIEVCRPAVSIDVSPRISSSPVPAASCPITMNNSFSMWSTANKAKYFGNWNYRYFHQIILLRAYAGWCKQSTAVFGWGFKIFVYSI